MNMSPVVLLVLMCFKLSAANLYSLSRGTCPEGYLSCYIGNMWRSNTSKCFKETSLCDNEPDCSDGSDEKFCHFNYNYGFEGFAFKFVQGPCPKDYVLCPSGEHNYNSGILVYADDKRCLHKKWLCDNELDCNDSDDEAFCPLNQDDSFHYIFKDDDCPEGYSLCRNGTSKYPPKNGINKKCIKNSWICDNAKDCSDSSDEAYCPYIFPNKIPTTDPIPIQSDLPTGDSTSEKFPTSYAQSTEFPTSYAPSAEFPSSYAPSLKFTTYESSAENDLVVRHLLYNFYLLVVICLFVTISTVILIGVIATNYINKLHVYKCDKTLTYH